MASPLRITSSKNPRLANAVKLRDSKHRKAQGLFLIDGFKSIELAVQSGFVLREFFLDEEHPDTPDLLKYFSEQAGDSYVTSRLLMSKLTYGDQSHECVAVAESFDTSIDSLANRLEVKNTKRGRRSGLFLVIDRIEKPGNLGAILRTADAAGVEGVLLSDSICDVFNPNAIRSSLGAIFTLPIASSSLDKVAGWLQAQNISIYTARVEGAHEYTRTVFADRAALVVGNEAMGLGARWTDESYQAVRIPMQGMIDSLNASVSTAVVLFEMVRQRTV
jgi:TrmH family RNA methyltransferase